MSSGALDAPNREQDFEEKAGAFEYHTSKMIDAAEQTSIHGKNVSKQLTDNIQAAAKDVSETFYAKSSSMVTIPWGREIISCNCFFFLFYVYHEFNYPLRKLKICCPKTLLRFLLLSKI